MSRFTDVDDGVVEVFLDTLEERFQSLIQLKIKLIFDTKKRIAKGKICLATVELANDKIKYFSKDKVATEGYDVVIILDRKAWELADEVNRKRIMSHELRHILINEKDEVKLIPHDVSGLIMAEETKKDEMVKDLSGLTNEQKELAWETYVRNGVNSLLDVYLPVSKDGNIGIRYTPHEVEKLESGPVYDETKADSVLISIVFKFDEPLDLTKPRH
jgi:hypothetical protein